MIAGDEAALVALVELPLQRVGKPVKAALMQADPPLQRVRDEARERRRGRAAPSAANR